jgi:hypothetical protein
MDKGVESKHNDKHRRKASSLNRMQTKPPNKGVATRKARRRQKNAQSRKGVSAPGNTCRPGDLASNSMQERVNPDAAQEPYSVSGGH